MNAKKAAPLLAILLGVLVATAFILRGGAPERGREATEDPSGPDSPASGAPASGGPPATAPRPRSDAPRDPDTRPAPPGRSSPPGTAPVPPPAVVPPAMTTPRTAPPTRIERSGTSTVHGTVLVAVKPVPARPTDVRGWPHCAELYPQGIPSEAAVIDAKNRIRWAMVRVVSDLPDAMRKLPSERVSLAFSKCRYRPRVLALRDALMLPLSNEDTAAHHYELAGARGAVAFHAELKAGEKTGIQFAPERDFVRFSCRLHPWETAWVTVLSHPFSFVTGPDGKYGLANLPPGTYTIEAWHESYRPVSREITVEAGKVRTVDFTFDRLRQ